MGRERPEARRAREKARYDSDPEYREKIKASRRAHYEANREKVKARAAARRKTHAREIFGTELKRRYGITFARWTEMLLAQSGRCAICVEPMISPHVDHCHSTGRVRGLLCSGCNHGLGKFKDDARLLRAAADYLS